MLSSKALLENHATIVNGHIRASAKTLAHDLQPVIDVLPGPEKNAVPSDFMVGLVKLQNELTRSDKATWDLMAIWDTIARFVTGEETKSILKEELARFGKTLGTMANYYSTWALFQGKRMYAGMTFQRHCAVASLYRLTQNPATTPRAAKAITDALAELDTVSASEPMSDSTFRKLVAADSIRLGVVKATRDGDKPKPINYDDVYVTVKRKRITFAIPADGTIPENGHYALRFIKLVVEA